MRDPVAVVGLYAGITNSIEVSVLVPDEDDGSFVVEDTEPVWHWLSTPDTLRAELARHGVDRVMYASSCDDPAAYGFPVEFDVRACV